MVGPLGDRDDGDGGGKGLEDAPTGPGIQQPGAEVVSIRYSTIQGCRSGAGSQKFALNGFAKLLKKLPKVNIFQLFQIFRKIFPEKIKVKRN